LIVDFPASPLHPISSLELDRAGVRLFLKRDDLIDPHLGGNKWRKLKYNLVQAHEQQEATLLTFGGAYSNHIYAVAAAGKRFGLRTIGVIRGEPSSAANATLSFARSCGMHLYFVDRAAYRRKHEAEFIAQLRDRFGPHFLLPEGGSNTLALPGCAEIVAELDAQLPSGYDVLATPVGSGGTLAGLASGLVGRTTQALGFAVLKGGQGLVDDVSQLLASAGSAAGQWRIDQNYHFNGYARCNETLFAFIKNFRASTGVQLDPIYNGKMLYGLFDQIRLGAFARGTTLVALHTGGLQGWAGISEKYGLTLGQ